MTTEPVQIDDPMRTGIDGQERQNRPGRFWIDVTFVFLVFFVYAGGPAPATNESHYLTRAKHFWNPEWCARDLFLSSPEAHPVFHTVFGWLTCFLDLPATAAAGRSIGWLLLAIGWVRLSRRYVAGRAMAVLTAALAVVLCDRAHMAGEWIVGGFEAKVPAFAFLLFALAEVVHDRWRAATVLAGIATAFHPLVGGWGLIALAWAWICEPSPSSFVDRFRSLLPALVVAAGLALLGVMPALQLDQGVDRLTQLGARRIYVYWRIGHHLLLQKMAWYLIARHLLLILAWLAAWRLAPRSKGRDRVQRVVAGCVLLAAMGATIEFITLQNWIYGSAWMRFYWYRMTDAMVPIGFSLAIGGWIVDWLSTPSTNNSTRNNKGTIALAMVLFLISISLMGTFLNRRHDPRPAADRQGRLKHGTMEEQLSEQEDWLGVCAWCRNFTDESALFLTPTYFQTFKWYAGRAEVATWKDVPQSAQALVEWQDRRRMARRIGLYSEDPPASFESVRQALAAYETDYVIVQRRWGDIKWDQIPVFNNSSFEIYALK